MLKNVELAGSLDGSSSILRFMSFTKFVDLVTFNRAFLANIATMQRDDPLEGVLPLKNMLAESGLAAALDHLVNNAAPRSLGVGVAAERLRALPPTPPPSLSYDTVFGSWSLRERSLETILSAQAKWLDIQCWHRSDVESMAMWKIYGGAEPSVAIRSTAARLQENLYPQDGDQAYISPVAYIDHRGDPCEVTHPLAPFLRKALPYDYEREVRVITYTTDQDVFADRFDVGRYIPVHLEDMISEVIISPTAPDWFLELVTRLTALKTTAPVNRSKVNQMPY